MIISDAAIFVLARILHVIGVVLWIGGVAFITTIVIPMVRNLPSDEERFRVFEAIEVKFALQAKIATLMTGLSGLFMLYCLNAWNRYLDPSYWWVHMMTFVWFLFTLVLFVFEPLFLHRLFHEAAKRDSERAFAILHRLHYLLLGLSFIAIIGAVAGTRGLSLFQ